mgnify:CR=1 FL=1
MPRRHTIICLYGLGDRVLWADGPGTVWRIVRWCYEEGTVSGFVQYGLVPEEHPTRPVCWAYEADVNPPD